MYKDPITDAGKTSKKGRVTLYRDISGEYYTDREDPSLVSELSTVFEDGELTKYITFEQVRANSNKV